MYSNEQNHNIARRDIYEYLNINIENFSELNFEVNGRLINTKNYIEYIKDNQFWMGDLEISVVSTLYDAVFYVFKQKEENLPHLLSAKGDINNTNKLFLNLCFINNNPYIILYEKSRIESINNG